MAKLLGCHLTQRRGKAHLNRAQLTVFATLDLFLEAHKGRVMDEVVVDPQRRTGLRRRIEQCLTIFGRFSHWLFEQDINPRFEQWFGDQSVERRRGQDVCGIGYFGRDHLIDRGKRLRSDTLCHRFSATETWVNNRSNLGILDRRQPAQMGVSNKSGSDKRNTAHGILLLRNSYLGGRYSLRFSKGLTDRDFRSLK